MVLTGAAVKHRAVSEDGRLVTRAIYRIVRDYGAQCGVHVRPHGLRHTSITAAVDASADLGLSIDEVRQFSRHQGITTLLTYRDQTRNVQGQRAQAVADRLRAATDAPPRPRRGLTLVGSADHAHDVTAAKDEASGAAVKKSVGRQ